MKNGSYLLVTLLACAFCLPCYGQSIQPTGLNGKVPYYIDMNNATLSTVSEIQYQQLNLKYNDQYKKASEIPLKIYNWKREVVAQASLSKTFGLNYYTIDLNELSANWEKNKYYTCEVVKETGKKFETLFKLVDSPDKQDPTVNIFVNPLNLDCTQASDATIEYYGEIAGGKTPYDITWYVVNENQTELLYLPKQVTLPKPGNTSVVTVDATPGYYVLLQVKDACGQMSKQMVHVVCKADTDKINTVFVQPLSQVPTKTGN